MTEQLRNSELVRHASDARQTISLGGRPAEHTVDALVAAVDSLVTLRWYVARANAEGCFQHAPDCDLNTKLDPKLYRSCSCPMWSLLRLVGEG